MRAMAGKLGGRAALCCFALLLAAPVTAGTAAAATSVALSPLNGTPDASPYTQISFLGVPAGEIGAISVRGSRTGRHSGHLRGYVSAAGASYVLDHPFSQGESVAVSAAVGPLGHTRKLSSTFTVARLSSYPIITPKPLQLNRADLVQRFRSQPRLLPPAIQVTANAGGNGGEIFLTPTHGYGQIGPMIIDSKGRLVWFHPVPSGDTATDLRVQSYGGQPVLTWWEGKVDNELGVGVGIDHVYDTAYRPIASVRAGNGYTADLHEFQLTPQGSAFVTAYSLVSADLSSAGGKADGILQDAIVQEIDVPTGLVMFEWHAYGHVAPDDSFSPPPTSENRPWDFFHVNSVSLDPWGDGNFIVSSRNTWAAYEINHVSGGVTWRIGGKRPSFKMGRGTGIAWQHDVRWQPDRTLTIFDNGASPRAHSESRAIRERIDFAHRTVSLVGRYAGRILSGSQGDNQVLPDGSSFVGWGEAPYMTEFSSSGQILFSARFPSPGQSYRAYRFPWSATPATNPAITVNAGAGGAVNVAASWNGATGVSAWRVIGGDSAANLAPLATAPSSGFETSIAVLSPPVVLAVQALGAEGQVLASSAAVPR